MKRTLPYFEHEFLSIFLFFFTQIFLILFRHFLFLFITFRFHLFSSFPFMLIFSFLDLQFFWTTISPSCCIKKKTLQLIPFHMHALPLYVLLLIHLFICCLFFSLRVFSFLTHLFAFPCFVFSVNNLSARKVYGTVASLKNVCVFPFLLGTCFTLVVFACLSLFRNFTFLIYSNLFLNICLFCSRSWMFLPLLLPFYVSLFLRLCLVWSSFFSPFLFSPVTYFPFFTQSHVFVLFPIVLSLCFFFLKKKLCFLFVGPFKSENWSFVFSPFFLFLTFFFWTLFFFQNKNSVGKTSCVLVYRPLFTFSFICFSCRFLVVFFLIPSQHVSFQKMSCVTLYFLLLFIFFPSVLSSIIKLPFFSALYYLHVSLR